MFLGGIGVILHFQLWKMFKNCILEAYHPAKMIQLFQKMIDFWNSRNLCSKLAKIVANNDMTIIFYLRKGKALYFSKIDITCNGGTNGGTCHSEKDRIYRIWNKIRMIAFGSLYGCRHSCRHYFQNSFTK